MSSQDELHLAASGQKHVFIRDDALILYFDKAETPFIARFDLDSLARATFEVTDKKDGIYHLTLRDYAGETQEIGRFSSKNDAHQALYLILQALLERGASVVTATKTGGLFRRFVTVLVKYLVIACLTALVLLGGLYGFARLSAPIENGAGKTVSAEPKAQNGAAALPEGEAMDADELLGHMMANPPPAAPSEKPAE